MEEIDEDVKIENDTVRQSKTPSNTVVQVKDLTKVYAGNSNCKNGCQKNQFYAVNELCLHIEADTLFCLLGPNGESTCGQTNW